MVVVKAVFLTILISGLVSLHGTGFSPCLGPGSAAALCDGGGVGGQVRPSRLPAGGGCEVRGRILSIIRSVTMLIRKLMQRLLLPKMLMLKMLKPKMQISPMLMPMFLM